MPASFSRVRLVVFSFSFPVEKILGIKSAKSYQNPRKGGPTIRNLKGRA